jgi:hypothetical protein
MLKVMNLLKNKKVILKMDQVHKMMEILMMMKIKKIKNKKMKKKNNLINLKKEDNE